MQLHGASLFGELQKVWLSFSFCVKYVYFAPSAVLCCFYVVGS